MSKIASLITKFSHACIDFSMVNIKGGYGFPWISQLLESYYTYDTSRIEGIVGLRLLKKISLSCLCLIQNPSITKLILFSRNADSFRFLLNSIKQQNFGQPSFLRSSWIRRQGAFSMAFIDYLLPA